MRSVLDSLPIVAVFLCGQLGFAYSPIWNVNSWNAERLSEVGIAVHTYRHELQTEDPPREWVEIVFDCSQVRQDQPVLLTAHLLSDRKEIATVRNERNAQGSHVVSLRLAAQENLLDGSYLDISIWKAKPDGGHAARGYQISLRRIVQLARDDVAKKAEDTRN